MSHLLHQLVFAAALFASFIRASSAAASSQQQQQQPPLVFGQCDRRHTNLTAQECVGKAILDTLTRVTEHPENYFGTAANEQDSEGGTTMRLIKLKFDNDTMLVDQRFEMDESRSSSGASIWEQLVYVIKKLANYGTDHGIMVSLPQWTKAFPPVTVIEEDQITQVINESRSKHGPYKKYALLFPLLATFKFLVIKSLLVPILFAVMFIKKLVVLAVMSLPYVLTMLRFCRNPNNFGFGGFGPGNLVATGAMAPVGQAAAFAPLTADMSGDYSSYVQQAAAASSQNNPYKEYSKNMMETMKATYRRRR